jgi:hypothetical protein
MTMNNTMAATGPSEVGHFLCDDWFDPLGFARAFAASSKSFSSPSWTLLWGGSDMNGPARAAAILPSALPARATAIGSVV